MGKLLFDSPPLVVQPEIAVALGLNEAIVVQQIHYWITLNQKTSKNFRYGYYWTYNSYEDWQKQFPFWSLRTISSIIIGLEKKGIIVSGRYNKMKMDRTKWYRIDYKKLENEVNKNATSSLCIVSGIGHAKFACSIMQDLPDGKEADKQGVCALSDDMPDAIQESCQALVDSFKEHGAMRDISPGQVFEILAGEMAKQ